MAAHTVAELTCQLSGWLGEAHHPALWGNEYISVSRWAVAVLPSELKVSSTALGEGRRLCVAGPARG